MFKITLLMTLPFHFRGTKVNIHFTGVCQSWALKLPTGALMNTVFQPFSNGTIVGAR
jgi:hypothetical protein